MKPIRVVYVVTGLQTGGAERMLFNVLSGLDRQRFEPVVVSLRQPQYWREPIEQLGVRVHSVDMEPSQPTLDGLQRLRRVVQNAAPDVLQGWMYHGNLAALLAALPSRNVPICWNIQHSMYGLRHEKPMTAAVISVSALLSRLPTRIVYVSHVSRGQHERLGYDAARGCVISNGVDTTVFRPLPDARADVRAELNLPPDALLIGLVARFHPQKDHRTFLEAAARLAKTHPNVHFLLAGRGTDAQNNELVRLVQAAGIEDRVQLLGERNDMPRITAALDMACSTSVFGEALSLALTEAMACGVPCVVTDIGDSARLVGQSGLVVPPRDVEALAKAWQQLVEAGAITRAALGQLAQQRVHEQYSLQQSVHAYEALYEALIEQSQQPVAMLAS